LQAGGHRLDPETVLPNEQGFSGGVRTAVSTSLPPVAVAELLGLELLFRDELVEEVHSSTQAGN
jgi:hypothetical protein